VRIDGGRHTDGRVSILILLEIVLEEETEEETSEEADGFNPYSAGDSSGRALSRLEDVIEGLFQSLFCWR